MLKFYYSGAPNPMKVALFLEEAGLPYEAIPVDTRKGDQHKPEYLADQSERQSALDCRRRRGGVRFKRDPALSRRKDRQIPSANTPKARGELLSWMMFVASGVGPYSGQSVHFRNFAPEKVPYAINRYAYEAQRHFGILDAGSASRNTWSATATRSWTWRLGLGAADSECAGRGRLGEIPEREAAGR